jgi:hypothetical protein
VCYDALVDALERGGELGECVYAIENAVKENGLPSIADKPLGYIADQGLYGEWITTDIPDFEGNMSTTVTSTTVTSTREDISDSTAALVQEEVLSLEELKQRMQTKLKEIDSQLDDL